MPQGEGRQQQQQEAAAVTMEARQHCGDAAMGINTTSIITP